MAGQRGAKARQAAVQSEECGVVAQERPANLSAGVCKELAYGNTEVHLR